jgi:hypothetical protein
VMRTTTIVTSSDHFIGFGFFKGAYDETTVVTNTVAERADNGWAPSLVSVVKALRRSPRIT